MQCSRIQENLSAYLDGELDPGEEALLKSHLEGCEACRSELESLRSTVELVRSVPRAHAPAVLKQRLSCATASRRPAWRFSSLVALVTAAALLLVCVVAVFMLNPEHLGESRDLAVGKERGRKAVEQLPKEVPSDVVRDRAVRQEDKKKAPEEAFGKLAGPAVEGEERESNRHREINKLRREAPGQHHRGGQESKDKSEAAVPEESEDAEEYGGLAERLRSGKEQAGGAAPRLSEETLPPSSVPLPDGKPDRTAPGAPGLADGADGTKDVLEVVIETRDPVEVAARVNEILTPHIGKKRIVTGAMLEELAKEDKGGEKRGEDSVEILVYIDSAKSGEVITQLRRLEKQAAMGLAQEGSNEAAVKEKAAEEKPGRPAEAMGRRVQESEKKTGKQTEPTERATGTMPTSEKGMAEKEQMRKEGTASEKAEESTKQKNLENSPDKSADMPNKSARGQKGFEKADSRSDGLAGAQSRQVPILIRIIRTRAAPAETDKLLERDVKPAPAARGK
jgi:hypothetical protein